MNELWTTKTQRPGFSGFLSISTGIKFASEPLSSLATASPVVYLSPDADRVLNVAASSPPHSTDATADVAVGMLIDRRIRPGQSRRRAENLAMDAARLPLERISSSLDRNEPLNVDCILEGLQQWYWNCDDDDGDDTLGGGPERVSKAEQGRRWDCFERAFAQALKRHLERHPERPLHKTPRSLCVDEMQLLNILETKED
jgi:hypothetical protein